MKKDLRISILVDNPKSWFVRYADALRRKLEERGHSVSRMENAEDMREGDVAFLLSCESLVPEHIRKRNTHTVVIHGSAVPEGRGWSPFWWGVLEGRSSVTVSLFEAEDAVDSGDVYMRETLILEGHELVDELREKEAAVIEALALRFVDGYPPKSGMPQKGEPTFYRRRTPQDSELDLEKSLAEQFDLLRIVDNERYPAFFKHRGHTYILKIYKKK